MAISSQVNGTYRAQGHSSTMDTFVVRIWMPAEELAPEQRLDMRGIVEHVSDGNLRVFEAPDQLLAFIREAVED
jgi:hypothetical protein